jgi:hypothetical protein
VEDERKLKRRRLLAPKRIKRSKKTRELKRKLTLHHKKKTKKENWARILKDHKNLPHF